MTNIDYIDAHRFSSGHKAQLQGDTLCGCFYCLSVFPPREIEAWLDPEGTALCPHCGIDAVIGASSGYPITREFLEKMRNYWF